MATSRLVPLEEYLHTSYEPECEWVYGTLREKSRPDGYHGYFQSFFVMFFHRQQEPRLRALTEVRIRVSASSYRVPDVLVIPADAPFLPLPKVTPLVCVEVLSPDDRINDLEEKIDDYLAMGVGAIWIVDPRRRTMATADATGIHTVQALLLEGTAVSITAAELFAELDQLEAL